MTSHDPRRQLEATIADKWIYIERLAYQLRMPLVRLVDSAGGSVKLLMQIGGTKIPEYTTSGPRRTCSRPCRWWAWRWCLRRPGRDQGAVLALRCWCATRRR